MIMPPPSVSCAWITPPRSFDTTSWRVNPKTRHSQSMAAGAFRYRNAGIAVDIVFIAVAIGLCLRMGTGDQDMKIVARP